MLESSRRRHNAELNLTGDEIEPEFINRLANAAGRFNKLGQKRTTAKANQSSDK